MKKVFDFSGSGKLLRAILADHMALDALIGEAPYKKFCCVVMMEDETEDDLCDFGKPEFGEHVEPELTYAETLVKETAVQQEMDEARIDLISLNGADGLVYQELANEYKSKNNGERLPYAFGADAPSQLRTR